MNGYFVFYKFIDLIDMGRRLLKENMTKNEININVTSSDDDIQILLIKF